MSLSVGPERGPLPQELDLTHADADLTPKLRPPQNPLTPDPSGLAAKPPGRHKLNRRAAIRGNRALFLVLWDTHELWEQFQAVARADILEHLLGAPWIDAFWEKMAPKSCPGMLLEHTLQEHSCGIFLA